MDNASQRGFGPKSPNFGDDVITNPRQIRDNTPLLKRYFRKRKPKSAILPVTKGYSKNGKHILEKVLLHG